MDDAIRGQDRRTLLKLGGAADMASQKPAAAAI